MRQDTENMTWIDRIQQWRSKRAQARDAATDAKETYSRQDPEGRKRWAKNPGRSDLKGVDTKTQYGMRQETLGFGKEDTDGTPNSPHISRKVLKPFFKEDSDLEKMDSRQLIDYIGQMKRGQKILKARITALSETKQRSRADSQEVKRLKEEIRWMKRKEQKARVWAKDREIYDDPPATIIGNTNIDPAHLALIESAQAIRYAKGRSESQVAREFGGAINQLARKRKGKETEMQTISLTAGLPGRAVGTPGAGGVPLTGDLTLHTHPQRDKLGYSRLIGIRPYPRGERGKDLVYDLINTAGSIGYDDRPSGGDLRYIATTNRPHLLSTPRRNILLVPQSNAHVPPDPKPDPATHQKSGDPLDAMLEGADKFAWDHSGASETVPSIKMAKKRVQRYQAERENIISSAIQNETNIRVRFYKKGQAIRYPSDTPRRSPGNTNTPKNAELKAEQQKRRTN